MSDENQPEVKPKQIPEDVAKSIASQLTKGHASESIVMDKVTEIASYIASIRQPERYNPNIPFAVVPEFMKKIDLEKDMPHPARIRKHPKFVDVESFCTYFEMYKGGHQPKIFHTKDSSGMKIMAIMDMDIQGETIMKEDGSVEKQVMPLPQWNSHKATLLMKFHEDYAAVRQASGQWFEQREFALFIEQYIHLFTDPVGADMLELAQELRGTRKASWRTGKRLGNNQTSLQYTEEIDAEAASGSLSIPQYITMRSPLFEGLEPIEYRAAFSYDIGDDHKVKFSMRLMTKLEEREAEEKVKSLVVEKTGKFIYNMSSFENLSAV